MPMTTTMKIFEGSMAWSLVSSLYRTVWRVFGGALVTLRGKYETIIILGPV